MKKFPAFFLPLFIIITSCGKKEDTTGSEDARQLFTLSAINILEFTERISNSKDSSEIDSLTQLFEKTITDINFSVPPETDLKLTEQENDSLFKLLKQMRSETQARLYELGQVKNDTLNEVEIKNL
ncbi:MAG: hypothetical protein J1F16_06825 [Muribaculaceae bacterium]|nr:hypothetical protein [Muribaculaceae bacterium]